MWRAASSKSRALRRPEARPLTCLRNGDMEIELHEAGLEGRSMHAQGIVVGYWQLSAL